MVNHHPVKFNGQRHFGGDMMFLVAERQDSTCPSFNPLHYLSLKHTTCMLTP